MGDHFEESNENESEGGNGGGYDDYDWFLYVIKF
jgi:hypothetical protein